MFNVRKTIQGRGKPNTLAQTCCMCLKKEKWNVNHIFLQKTSWRVTEIDKDNVTINIYIVYVISHWSATKYEHDCGQSLSPVYRPVILWLCRSGRCWTRLSAAPPGMCSAYCGPRSVASSDNSVCCPRTIPTALSSLVSILKYRNAVFKLFW